MEQARDLVTIPSVNNHSALQPGSQTPHVPPTQALSPTQSPVASTATNQRPRQAQSASQQNGRGNRITKNTGQKPKQTKQAKQPEQDKEPKQAKQAQQVKGIPSHKQGPSGANKLLVIQPQMGHGHYGSPATIQASPASYQAALRLKMSRLYLPALTDLCPKPLFVYGSLMMSELMNWLYLDGSEHIFVNQTHPGVKIYTCAAELPEYARLAIDGSHEPIMTHRNFEDCVHGMLIWGLTDEHYRILDRYEDDEFVKQRISLPQRFEKVEVKPSVTLPNSKKAVTAQAYVWPNKCYDKKGKSDLKWTVDEFWQEAPSCQAWRVAMKKFFPGSSPNTEEEVQRIMTDTWQDLETLRAEVAWSAQERATTQQLGPVETTALQRATWEGAEPHAPMAVQDLSMRDAGIPAGQEPFQPWVTAQAEAGYNPTRAPQNFEIPEAGRAAPRDTNAWYRPPAHNSGMFDVNIPVPLDTTAWDDDGSPEPQYNTSPYTNQATTFVNGRQYYQNNSA